MLHFTLALRSQNLARKIFDYFNKLMFYLLLNIGAKRGSNDQLQYLLEYKDGWPNNLVSSAEALKKCPKLLLQFLEAHITMTGGQKRVSFTPIKESDQLIGDPIRVSCKYNKIEFFEYCF